jgi:hypothetical protein
MPIPRTSTGSDARKAAFALAFTNSRSPLPFERRTDGELISMIQKRIPAASDAECREALVRVCHLSGAVCEICEKFRSGGFGAGEDAVQNALDALCDKVPGFSFEEYREAFAAGMLWTAF